MKAICLLVAFLCCSASAALGQGTLIFSNSPASLVYMWHGPLIPALPGRSDFIDIVYATPGTPSSPLRWWDEQLGDWLSENPGWTLGASTSLRGNNPGLFNGGVITLGGVSPGGEISYRVYGGTDAYADPTDALNNWLGLSDVFTTRTGLDAASAVPLTDSFTGLVIYPSNFVPEPSVGALGLAFGLLFAARRLRERRPR